MYCSDEVPFRFQGKSGDSQMTVDTALALLQTEAARAEELAEVRYSMRLNSKVTSCCTTAWCG